MRAIKIVLITVFSYGIMVPYTMIRSVMIAIHQAHKAKKYGWCTEELRSRTEIELDKLINRFDTILDSFK